MSDFVDDSERFNLPGVLAELAAKEWEALEVIKADICQWLTKTLQLDISPSTFLDILGTGVDVCRLAALIQKEASAAAKKGERFPFKVPMEAVSWNTKALPGSFHARDNASNFITWCRHLGVEEAVIFESEGLVLGKDEKRVILCLLDVARFAERVGVAPPQLVQMEREIDELERVFAEELKEIDTKYVNSKSPPVSSATPPSATPLHAGSAASPSATTASLPIATPSVPPPPTAAATPSAPPSSTVAAAPPLTAGRMPSALTTPPLAPVTPAISAKKSVSRIPVRSSRRLANRKTAAPTPQRLHQASREKEAPTPLRRTIGRPRKRARSEEEEEEECHTPSRKKPKVWTGKVEANKTVQAKEKEVRVRDSVDVRVMKKMAECTCRNKIAVTKCGNGKFIVKGASGREMTTYARVLSDRLMVRVGGGWSTLDHFLLKHDPCRVHTLSATGAGKAGGKHRGTLNR